MTYLADWIEKISEPEQLVVTAAIDQAREMLEQTKDDKSVSWVSLSAKVAIYEAVQAEKRVRI